MYLSKFIILQLDDSIPILITMPFGLSVCKGLNGGRCFLTYSSFLCSQSPDSIGSSFSWSRYCDAWQMVEATLCCGDFLPATFSVQLINTYWSCILYNLNELHQHRARTHPRWRQGRIYCFRHFNVRATRYR